MLEVEVFVRQLCQPAAVNEDSCHDEHGLIVRCGRIAKCSQIPASSMKQICKWGPK